MSNPNSTNNPTNPQNQDSKSYKQTASDYVNQKYETWMPWMEDQYLKWFTKDNKASYTAKDTLSKTKITGNSQIDKTQDDVNNLVGGTIGTGGIAQPVGEALSKEGITRAEEGNDGGVSGTVGGGLKSAGEGVGGAVQGAGGMLGLSGGGGKK